MVVYDEQTAVAPGPHYAMTATDASLETGTFMWGWTLYTCSGLFGLVVSCEACEFDQVLTD